MCSTALGLLIPLNRLNVEGEQQVMNDFKINGKYCFTLIKLVFIKSKSSSSNRCML